MVSRCFFILLLLLWCGKACDNSILVAKVVIVAETHSDKYSDTDSRHNACINDDCHELPNLPGNDYQKKKSDWFNMDSLPYGSAWNGLRICDIDDFRIKENGKDGWKIAKITVLIRGNNDRVYVPVFETSLDHWIDGDSSLPKETDNLIQGGWRDELAPRSTIVNPQNVYLIAETGHGTNDKSDTPHKLNIYYSNINVVAATPNLDGDDMMKGKTDWWTFDRQFENIDVNQITDISIRAGGNDAWGLDDVAVIIDTNYGWYVPVLMTEIDTENYVVQNDEGNSYMEKYLDMIPNWKSTPFAGFYETIGYWSVGQTSNGGADSFTLSEWKGIEESIATEEEQMESFSEEITTEVGMSVTNGVEFEGYSSEVQYSFSTSQMLGTQQASTIRNAVENTVSSGNEVSCSFVNPDPGEHFVLWVWTVYRKSNIENEGATLKTCNGHFKTDVNSVNRNIPPNCIPGGCLAGDHDCLDCIDSSWVVS